MTSLEKSVAVECQECTLGEDADDYNEMLTFAEKHQEHTGHSVRWTTNTSPPDVGIEEGTNVELECRTCDETWSFDSFEAAETFRSEHAEYTDHEANGTTETTVWTGHCNRCGISQTFLERESVETWCDDHRSQSNCSDKDLSSLSRRDQIKNFKQLIQELEDEYDHGAPIPFVVLSAEEQGWSQIKAQQEVDNLKQKGEVYEPARGHLRTT
ncbi:hypothetical protein [Haladaptatus cibarius]|uniref:hypothetical protein n=1 Tax=Haladaptatus cibarius TaxID=453847 RepID=UPI000678D40C|nr:hypothetical protein [Haladaptatus cibarius]